MDDIDAIKQLTLHVKSALAEIESFLQSHNAVIVFCEGDSLLGWSSELISMSVNELDTGELTFSAGIGRSPSMALLALKKAKGLGKRRVIVIEEILT